MKLIAPKNPNYCATVIEIKALVPLEGCNNVQAAIIMGNQVVVSNDVKISDIGLYFPVETALSKIYLNTNNLYRKPELNSDISKKGYFEENGRIRCVKFRGHKSEGLFMPLESVKDFIKIGDSLNVGDEFDELNGHVICQKYVVKSNKISGQPGSKRIKTAKQYESKLVENQFRFHTNTEMLYKNLHRINPDSLIQISYKLHGTSGISSYVLCKKSLKWYEKALTKLGVDINDKEYDYLYSSRKVIKNEELNPNAVHYYSEDIWGIAHKELEPFLQKGMTFYYEIVGFLPSGGMIQKDYDYGYGQGKHGVYIYRITTTNSAGKVFEFSGKQVQDFCKKNGLNAVPELYYGYAKDLFTNIYHLVEEPNEFLDQKWNMEFLTELKKKYNEKQCFMCKTTVPEEGIVIRVEGLEIEAFKCKSLSFYERETKLLDKGEIDIESDN